VQALQKIGTSGLVVLDTGIPRGSQNKRRVTMTVSVRGPSVDYDSSVFRYGEDCRADDEINMRERFAFTDIRCRSILDTLNPIFPSSEGR
jgi:hypothetical protein